jgi:glycine cleavage system aminomethyltransferase T
VGRDAEKLLQRLCANDVAVQLGRVVYTGMLNPRGGYESDLTVMRIGEDSFMLITGTIQAVRDYNWIQRHIEPDEFVTVIDVTSSYAVLNVMGPKSRALLSCLSPNVFSNAAFPYFTHQEIEVGYATARASRVSYVGELGWELIVPAECAVPVYDQLVEAGVKFELRHAGSEALASLRIEKSFRAWGRDIGPDYTPLEAGLSFAVKWDKSNPFIGSEALLRLRETPVSRRLIGLKLQDPEALPLGGEPILHMGKIVGLTTSGAFGHTLGCGIALGYVRTDGQDVREMIEAGGFEIEIACQRFPAAASLRAAYDSKGERMKTDG